jgi:hypothetical protein
MECRKQKNLEGCGCTYMACDRRGMCCECVQHHVAKKQIPGCFFPPAAEKQYDRSFAAFVKAWNL